MKGKNSLTQIVIVALFLLLIPFVWLIPKLQINSYNNALNSGQSSVSGSSNLLAEKIKKQLELENLLRITVIQAVSGWILLLTVFLTWRTVTNADDKKVTDLFTRAVQNIKSDQPEVRIGGIYTMRRIAQESEQELLIILKILYVYIRRRADLKVSTSHLAKSALYKTPNAPSQKSIDTSDIESALLTIGELVSTNHLKAFLRRVLKIRFNSSQYLDFNNLNLQNINLCNARIAKVNFQDSILDRGILNASDMRGADLMNASLQETIIQNANLSRARLLNANLHKAVLSYSDLSGANLNNAILENATLNETDLKGAQLEGVNLRKAAMSGTILENANLKGANIENVYFNNARLKGAEISFAKFMRPQGLSRFMLEQTKDWRLAKFDLETVINLRLYESK